MARRSSYPMQSEPVSTPAPFSPVEHPPSKPSNRQLPRYLRAIEDQDTPKGRTLIICLDGTGDKFDGDNSNIVHLVSCLKKDDPQQLTYYQTGIGTYNSGGLSDGIAAAVDMAVGSGLGVHIRDAYRFLMQTYREGDKICLFGFSRGAYTARCLAGMLHKVGLLPAHNRAQIPFAYKFYKDDTQNGWDMSADFKRTFCIDVNVYFVGVFDSVASVGFIPRKLPLSSTPKNKPFYFRHAMGLDERRSKFKVCRYQQKDHTDPESRWTTKAATEGQAEPPRQRLESNSTAETYTEGEKIQRLGSDANNIARDVDCLEVWFAGCHADVGGGAVANEQRHKPSQIPLRWMIRQCFECNTGILFNTHRLAEEGIDVHMLYPVYHKLERPTVGPSPNTMEKYHQGEIAPISRRSTVLEAQDDDHKHGLYNVNLWQDAEKQKIAEHWVPEQMEDCLDAIAPLNDQLVQAKFWWILEVWPIKVRLQPRDSDTWVKKVRMNMGRYRVVQESEPNLHWTVQQRMQDTGYKPQVRLGRNATWRFIV
ncbi:hypothetical protein D6D21_02648 [Aureobasidium pullulans]|uniref:T6SS Phospholipase effector Tle1-like catalytic domain-containing protein n=1 Tax=Aureobasidium pullulans TaxID=5580 RepID=A0AB74J5B7_AURPU|nr:hypothetical protein D6D21_02648 [Aureobasidium pullulans]